MDAKSDTHICPSPIADDHSGGADSESRPSFLIMIDGGLPGTMFQLDETGASLGRSVENTIRLAEATISRCHARFSVDINGHVGLTDLGSVNGTYLNGQRLQPHSSAWVRNGDRVRIGASTVLKFVKLDAQDEKFQRELFERMVRDSLTGLFNRRYFLEQIGPLQGKSMESGLGLAVILIDLDHFKRINDSHGHDAGDAVLRDVSQLLREVTRPDDLVARYGGEEFVVAIPVALVGLAQERAERIRREIGEHRIRFRNQELRVTASLGMACVHGSRNRCPVSLITEADSALYRAKKGGRNRLFFRPETHDGDPATPRTHDLSRGQFTLIS